jgi:hypothetical protein
MRDEPFHTSTTWESLLPEATRAGIWLLTTNVTLTLNAPNQTATTFQVRRCTARNLQAHSLALVTTGPEAPPQGVV